MNMSAVGVAGATGVGQADAPLRLRGIEWPAFWQGVRGRLVQDGYRPNTLRVYRQLLRDLRTFLRDGHGVTRPDGLTEARAGDFLVALSRKRVSWSWLASAIAVMRKVFDRLCALHVTRRMVTPRRNWPLPETLSARELRLLFDALPNPRDRLLVALLAGCGLRVSEACRIHWADFNRTAGTLRIEDPSEIRSRTIAVPAGLLPLFQGLAAVSRASSPMICGVRANPVAPAGLSARQAERLIQSAARRAGILKRVTPMGLRHTHAVRRLLAGENIRAVQESLGHRAIETTLRYQACIPPPVTSPADPGGPAPVIAEMTNLLHRLAVAFPAATPAASSGGPEAAPVADTKARPSAVASTSPLQPAFAQGP